MKHAVVSSSRYLGLSKWLLYVAIVLVASHVRAADANEDFRRAQDKEMYIASAMGNLGTKGDYGAIGVAMALHVAWQLNPQLTQTQPEMLNIVARTRDQYNQWKATDNGHSANDHEKLEKAADLVATGLGIPGISQAVAVGKLALLVRSEMMDEAPKTWSPMDTEAAQTFAYFRSAGRNVLAAIYDDAKGSPERAEVINMAIGQDVQTLTTESATEILDHNPALKATVAAGQMNGLLTGGILPDIQASSRACMEQVTDVAGKSVQLLAVQNHTLAEVTSVDEQLQHEAEERNRRQINDLRLEAANAGFNIIGAAIGGPKGQKVAAAGQTAVQLASAISNYANNTSKLSAGLGAVVLTGNVLGALETFSSIFGAGGTEMGAMRDQLNLLSEQITGLRTVMVERFDRVDAELAAIYKSLETHFVIIDNDLTVILARLQALNEHTTELSRKMDRINEALGWAKRDEFEGYVRQYYGHKRVPLTSDKFSDLERVYYTAMRDAASPLLLDTAFVSASPQTAIERIRGNPPRGRMPFVETDYVLYQAGALPTELPGNSDELLPNFEIWQQVALAYIDLATQPTGKNRETYVRDARNLKEFIEGGERIQTALAVLARIDPQAPGTGNAFFAAQLDAYAAAAKTLQDTLADLRKQYVDHEFHGMDPWGVPEQPVNANTALDHVPVFIDGTQVGESSIASVAEAQGAIANAYYVAPKDYGLRVVFTNLQYQNVAGYSTSTPGHVSPQQAARGVLPESHISYFSTFSLAATATLFFGDIPLSSVNVVSDVIPGWPTFKWTGDGSNAPAPPPPPADPKIPAVQPKYWMALMAKTVASNRSPGDIAKAMENAKGAVGLAMEKKRRELIDKAWRVAILDEANNGRIEKALWQMSYAKTMLWALAQLAVPSSFATDEQFRGLLCDGSAGLFDRDSFRATIAQLAGDDPTGAALREKFELMNWFQADVMHRHADLGKALTEKLKRASQNGGETLIALKATLDVLHALEEENESLAAANVPSR